MLEVPALWMFPALFTLVFLGIPVSFSMIGLSFGFGYWFFGDTLGQQMFSRLQDVSQNYVLTALPLFIFMGAALERSGIAGRLFYAIQPYLISHRFYKARFSTNNINKSFTIHNSKITSM